MRIIAIANAKGGVGKSFIASNLSVAVSQAGKSVVLVDLDPHVPSVDLLFPDAPLGALWTVQDAKACIHPVNERLSVLVAGPSSLASTEADERLTTEWRALNANAEFVLIDLGPGLSNAGRSVLAVADQLLVVVTPEPASLLGALRTARVAIAENPKTELTFVVNKAASKWSARRVASRFVESTGRFLSQEASFWGHVLLDDKVVGCNAKRLVAFKTYPKSGTAKRIADIASRLMYFQGFVDETLVVTGLRKSHDADEKKAA